MDPLSSPTDNPPTPATSQDGKSDPATTPEDVKPEASGPKIPDAGTSNAETNPDTDSARELLEEPVVSGPVKSLAQLGLKAETLQYFGMRHLLGRGVLFPIDDFAAGLTSASARPCRLRGIEVGVPEYRWIAQDPGAPLPVYNGDAASHPTRRKRGIYIAQEEADVWVLHQNGFAALSLFGVSDDPARLGSFLQNNAIREVHFVFHNDEPGRRAALRVYDACVAAGIVVCWRILNTRKHYEGARVSDLFAATGFESARFGEALMNLPYAPLSLLDRWREDLRFEPAPEPGTEDEFFPCLDDEQLEALPLPTCLIEGVLLAGKATMMTGVHNLGKSAIALDMSLCISQGLPWCGHKTLQGPVTYIAAEGGEGIQARLRAWKQARGLERVPGFRAIPLPVQLHEGEQRERLVRTLQRFAAQQALLVVDTLSQCSLGLSEMSSEDMALFLSCLAQVSRTTGAATLILHHNNRGNTYRGSSALPANCDGHLELLGESGQASVKLHVSKIKDFPDGANWPLRRQQVTLDALVDAQGKPVTSVLFVPAEAKGKASGVQASEVFEETGQAEAKGASKTGKSASGRKAAFAATTTSTGATVAATASGPVLTPKESVTLQALRALCAEGQKGGNKTSGTGGVGATASEWKLAADRQGVPSATFDRAKKKLVDRGLVGCDRPGQAGARYFPV